MTREEAPPIEIRDEPLVGWRCWFVLPHELLLRPIYKRGLAWKPRQAFEAVCPEKIHEVPHDDVDKCRCGIWTVREPKLLDETGWTTAPPKGVGGRLPGILIVGEIALWGKVVEHERGWRASMAYPRHLYAFTDDPMIAQTLRERYGVPVEWGADAEAIRELLPGSTHRGRSAAPTLAAAPSPVPTNAAPMPGPGQVITMLTSVVSEVQAALRQAVVTMQRDTAAERQAFSAIVADVKGELRRVLEQTEKFHQQAVGIALAHARAGLMPAARNELVALKEELSRQGITMDQVAAQAGVHRTSVCNVLAGRSTSAPVIAAMAKLLKTDAIVSTGVDLVARATALGWSQNELARRAGVNNSVLSKTLRGLASSAPALEAAERVIADAEQDRRKSDDDPAKLKDAAKRLGITHAMIAAEATKTSRRGCVGVTSVSKTLSGGSKSQNIIDVTKRLIQTREPEVVLPQRQHWAGHPALAARLAVLGITHADVAQAAGCSRPLVSHVLAGRSAGVRGLNTAVVQAARALIAQRSKEDA